MNNYNIIASVYVFILFTASGASVNSITHNVSPGGELNSISRAVQLASEGDTILVDGGSYNEHLVINKALKLIGKNNPRIIGNGKGTVIKITSPGTTIKGFHISGSGESLNAEDCGILLEDSPNSVVENNILEDVLFGIYLKNSPDSVIKENKITGKDLDIPDRGDGIRLWYSSGVLIKGNKIKSSRDFVMWWSGDTVIENNIVEDGRYGLHYMYSNNNLFKNNIFRGNLVGGFLMYSKNIRFEDNKFIQNQGIASGYGVGFKDLDNVEAEGNMFIDNRVGIYIDNSPSSYDIWNKIKNNTFAFNDIGASLMPSIERNIITENNFMDNSEQVEVRGGGTLKRNKWFEGNKGNYWSDYKGYDENNDGIGDFPYIAESLFENMMDKNSVLRIFIHSPVTQALDIASKAFPIFKPEPKVKDEFPLMIPFQLKLNTEYSNYKNPKNLFVYLILILIPITIILYLLKPFSGYLIDRDK